MCMLNIQYTVYNIPLKKNTSVLHDKCIILVIEIENVLLLLALCKPH